MRGKTLYIAFFSIVQLSVSPSWADDIESDCYHFFYPSRYLSYREMLRYANDADRRCSELKAFLEIDRRERIPVHVREGQGISNTQSHANRAIELYYLKSIRGIRAPLVHETTHILIDCRINTLKEGIAVAMEKRFGEICTHPTYGFELDDWMKAILISGRYIPLHLLEKGQWSAGPFLDAIVSYCESGSFCEYLIDEFGMDAFLRLFRLIQKNGRLTLDGALKAIFRDGLEDLEKKWIEKAKGQKVDSEDVLLLKEAIEKGRLQQVLIKRMEEK